MKNLFVLGISYKTGDVLVRSTFSLQDVLEECYQKAKEFGFSKCYLETMPYMEAAQKLYRKSGFQYLEEPMGCTGHSSCPVWMIKTL